MSPDAVVILSGGLDSTTLAYDLLESGLEIHAVTFDYGQKHKKEISYAQKTCKALSLPQKIIPMQFMSGLLNSSLTTDVPVPEGHYAEESMKSTVVPNRNMIMLSIAGGYALSIGAEILAYGAHAGDHTIYPDCRPEFIDLMDEALQICHWEPLHLAAPYSEMTKGEIVKRGLDLGVDYANTWTCYKGKEHPCGKCGSCIERAEAFEFAGAVDPGRNL